MQTFHFFNKRVDKSFQITCSKVSKEENLEHRKGKRVVSKKMFVRRLFHFSSDHPIEEFRCDSTSGRKWNHYLCKVSGFLHSKRRENLLYKRKILFQHLLWVKVTCEYKPLLTPPLGSSCARSKERNF